MEARFYQKSDISRIAQLLDAFNREFDTPTPGTEFIEANLRRLYGSESLWIVVMGEPVLSLAVVSFAHNLWYAQPIANLDEFYTVPTYRSQGFGDKVIAFVEEALKARGIEEFNVGVDEADLRAMNFYEAHGWEHPMKQEERAFCLFKKLI